MQVEMTTPTGTEYRLLCDANGNLLVAPAANASGVTAPTRSGGQRSAGALRSGITTADKLATPGTVVLANNVGDVSGSLVFNTAYKVAVAAATRFGPTVASAVASLTTTNDAVSTHTIDVTIPTVTGAEFYDIFESTDAAPKLLARVSAAQVAAGGYTVTAVGTVTQTGTAAAGHVTLAVAGTGNLSSATSYTTNNAWVLTQSLTPTDINGALVPVLGAGYTNADALIRVNVPKGVTANLTTLLSVFTWSADLGDWVHSSTSTRNWLSGAVQTPLFQRLALNPAPSGMPVCVLVESLTMATGGSLDIALVGIY